VRFAGDRGYAVGRRCVLGTTDAGRSWQVSQLRGTVRYSWLYGLHVTPEEAWTAGYGEAIFRAGSTDESWQRVAIERERGDGALGHRAQAIDLGSHPEGNGGQDAGARG
jgi:photosystem II stability/assembly factor-like uncharacterized protein